MTDSELERLLADVKSDRSERKQSLADGDKIREAIGYIVHQHSVRADRPVKAYDKWIGRRPADYRKYVLAETSPGQFSIQDDPHKLAMLKHYRSLMPMAGGLP